MRYKSHMDNDSMNIGQLLLKVTKQYQNNVAIECDEQKLTYFELFKQAYSIIGWLRSFESSRVAIFMSREINVYCMIYACVLSGKTYMPIPLTSSKENISYMLQKAHIDYVITDKQNFVYVEELNKCCEYNFNVILFEDLIQKLDVKKTLVVGNGAKIISDYLSSNAYKGRLEFCMDIDSAISKTKEMVEINDVVLVKASRAIGLERVANALMNDFSENLNNTNNQEVGP